MKSVVQKIQTALHIKKKDKTGKKENDSGFSASMSKSSGLADDVVILSEKARKKENRKIDKLLNKSQRQIDRLKLEEEALESELANLSEQAENLSQAVSKPIDVFDDFDEEALEKELAELMASDK